MICHARKKKWNEYMAPLTRSMFIYTSLYSVRVLLSKQWDSGQRTLRVCIVCIRTIQSNDLSYSLYSSYLVLVLHVPWDPLYEGPCIYDVCNNSYERKWSWWRIWICINPDRVPEHYLPPPSHSTYSITYSYLRLMAKQIRYDILY